MKNFTCYGAIVILMTYIRVCRNCKCYYYRHYKIVILQTPYSVEVCSDVAVSGDKTGDTLKGAIQAALSATM